MVGRRFAILYILFHDNCYGVRLRKARLAYHVHITHFDSFLNPQTYTYDPLSSDNISSSKVFMASASNTTTEAPAVDLLEDKIISDSNSSHGDQEKSQAEKPVAEGQLDPGKSEWLTALLQVVGAFFLMFNSWYVASTV
jgi:hypothetical protein